MSQSLREQVIEVFRALQLEAHNIAKANGFWANETDDECVRAVIMGVDFGRPIDEVVATAVRLAVERARATHEKPLAVQIALQHSELSEALEAERHGNPPSEHIPEFTAVEEEYADVVIRIFDTAEKRGIRLAEAILAKMAFNRTRPKRHGKKF